MKRISPWHAAAALAVLPALALPLSNPDLFWHLSAAKRMVATGAIPSADWLSWTMAGEPWVDFEWLAQLVFYGLYKIGGLGALWLFKAVMLSASAAVAWSTLTLYGAGLPLRAAALAFWGAAMLPRADIRPELFSLLLFSVLLRRLEKTRLGAAAPSGFFLAGLFAAWANLHAGFPYGLLLLALYIPAGIPLSRAAAAVGATLLQPHGWRIYDVLVRHAHDLGVASAQISEWAPPAFDNPWRWPHWLLVALALPLSLAVLLRKGALGRGATAWVPAAALAVFAVAASRHARLGVYFAAAAVPLCVSSAGALLKGRSPRPAAFGAAAALLTAFSVWAGSDYGLFRRVFEDRFVPARAAAFLREEAAVLSGRRLYHSWGWGGFFGWRLHPDFQVFQDGRYLFHGLLGEAAEAVKDPRTWQSFLDGRRVEVAVLENLPISFSASKRYPDGRVRDFPRPFYVFFMPRDAWALVHWDEKALVFARRAYLPADWLESREYRWARPNDDAALEEGLAEGAVPREALADELARHAAATGRLATSWTE